MSELNHDQELLECTSNNKATIDEKYRHIQLGLWPPTLTTSS